MDAADQDADRVTHSYQYYAAGNLSARAETQSGTIDCMPCSVYGKVSDKLTMPQDHEG